MTTNTVASLLHLSHGVTPDERELVVAGLARLDDHLGSYPDGAVRLQLGVKERDTVSQRATLEAWIPAHPPIVATSERADLSGAIAEVRDEMVRQLTDIKQRDQDRARGSR